MCLGKIREKFPLEMAEIQAPVVAADINDDGKIEIVTTDSHGNVAAWTAQGAEIWEVHLKSLIPQASFSILLCCLMITFPKQLSSSFNEGEKK